MTNYLASDKVRSAAERLRSDAIRLAREKDEQAFKNNAESSKRLGERLNDIEYWKGELEKTKNKMKGKIEDTESKRREVEKQLVRIGETAAYCPGEFVRTRETSRFETFVDQSMSRGKMICL